MKQSTGLQRGLTVLLGIGAVALLLTAGLPHRHDHVVASHPSASCSLCKLHEGFSAAPTPRAAISALPAAVIGHVSGPRALQCVQLVSRSSRPRAPPHSS